MLSNNIGNMILLIQNLEIKGLFNVIKKLGALIYLVENIPRNSDEPFASFCANKEGFDSVCVSISSAAMLIFPQEFTCWRFASVSKISWEGYTWNCVHDEAINLVVSKKRKGKLTNLRDFKMLITFRLNP